MSLTMTKTKVPARAAGGSVGATSLPQVNLLPPEVRAARGLVNVKRWLAIALVIVVVGIGLVYAIALFAKGSAEDSLASEQARTDELQAEVAKYAEVPRVLANLARTEDALKLGTSTEIQWKTYLDAITAVLPADVSIDSFTVAQSTPWMAAAGTQDPLVTPGVANISFTVRASTLPDTAAWLDALDSIPNVSSPSMSMASLTADTGEPYFAVTSTLQVDATAVVPRFADTKEG
ncbi:hypothetical protein [Cellulomonas sp. URHE0023]|uniref:hypothetical protein n=1 Tax=Cellulomonas sp. URHE0023 TaxID=1380354 RepID=UPI00047F0D08|nr:hypothetical protein [Cellulomonas sp. URHE0023]